MCGPEDPLFTPLLPLARVPFQGKESVHKTPFWENLEILASTASIFTQILAHKPPNLEISAHKPPNLDIFSSQAPQILKFSTHKPPFSEANVSSQAPHFGNPGRTPLPEKKLSAPPSGFDPTLGKAVAQRICSVVYSDSPFLKSDQYNSKNQNNMSTHLTIRNENHPNPRIATPKKKGLQWRDYFKNHKTNVFPITIWK